MWTRATASKPAFGFELPLRWALLHLPGRPGLAADEGRVAKRLPGGLGALRFEWYEARAIHLQNQYKAVGKLTPALEETFEDLMRKIKNWPW